MFGFRKVLIGVDPVPSEDHPEELVLSAPTREAVDLALRAAESSRTELTFLTVLDAAAHEEDNAAVDRMLESLVGEASQRNVTARAQVATGRSWMEIIKAVLRDGHQMVIVGSPRQSPARRLMLGSTGSKLLRKCPCPVWVVRPKEPWNIRTVIVADDLTEVGRHCLDLGVSAARLLDARLLVLHAVHYPLSGPLRHMGTPDEQIEDYREKTRQEAEQRLNERLSMTDYRTISQGARIEVAAGQPDLIIEAAIEEHSADLLVMGTIARGGIPGLLVGNTAERLFPVIDCSVIAVKPDDFICPIQAD